MIAGFEILLRIRKTKILQFFRGWPITISLDVKNNLNGTFVSGL